MRLTQRVFLVAFAVFSCLIATRTARGQTSATPTNITPDNERGVRPYETYGGVRENINLATGDLNITIPLLNLPGRNGNDLELAMMYDSKIWNLNGFYDPSFGSRYWWAFEWETQGLFGWRFNIPRLHTTSVDLGSGYNCWSGYYVISLPDGSSHKFSSVRTACHFTDSTGTRDAPEEDTPIGDSDDVSYIRLNGNTNTATTKDGRKFWLTTDDYGFTKISDPNGNTITQTPNLTELGTINDSLGRSITFNYSSPSSHAPASMTYHDSSGVTQAVTFVYSNYNLSPTFTLPSGATGQPPFVQSILSAIVLPNGGSYTFEYNNFGELTKITYPTGGYTRYDYDVFTHWTLDPASGGGLGIGTDFRELIAKYECRESSGTCTSEDTTTYTPTVNSTDSSNEFVDVTGPDGNRTRFQFTANNSCPDFVGQPDICAPRELMRWNYQGSSALLRTTQTEYNELTQFALPIRVTTTLNDTNQVTKTEWDYDTSSSIRWSCTTLPCTMSTITKPIDNVVTKREYDYGAGAAGPLVRRKVLTWLRTNPINGQDYTSTSLHILDRKTSETVYDGSGVLEAQSQLEYDSYTEGLTASGAVQHDSAYLTTYTTRGNATAVMRWRNTDGVWLTTRSQFDDAGNVRKITDPRSNFTTFSYADSWGDASCSPTGGSAAAYRTSTTNALNQVARATYNSCTGTVASVTDPNNQTTTFSYDPLGRLTVKSFPDGGQTSISYNDVPPVSATTTQKISSALNMTSTELMDGLGRIKQSQLNSDPDCSTGDKIVKTDTTYDALGRVHSVSNPYCATNDSTYGVTTYAYDALGRTTQVTRPDGATVLSTYTGRALQVQDEGNGTQRVTRVSQTDGLGRLASVCEVSSTSLIGSGGTPGACGQDIAGTGFLTTYQYDALDNLTQVNQAGVNPRTFSYDSLSRLTQASNPESGATTYTYDANGNVITKTDARGITTCFGDWNGTTSTCNGSTGYDALNRVLKKTYSDGTPTVQFGYDTQNMTIGTLHITATNYIGRLSWEVTLPYPSSITNTSFSYDPMGRINHLWSCENVSCSRNALGISYSYDLIGNETDRNLGTDYASAYNTAGRLISLTQTNYTNANNPANLLSGATYDAFGHMTFANLGNGLSETWKYDNRGRLASRASGTGCNAGTCSVATYSLAMSYAPNGDVLSANDSVNGNWAYGYDAFNRLICSNLNTSTCPPASGTPTYTYEYDRFGNRWHQNGPNSMNLTFTGNNPLNPQNNNRIDGYSYDAAGNLLNDGIHSYNYDSENRITSVDNGATGYFYDADGRRLEKSANGTPTFDYFYGRDSGVLIIIQPPAPLYQEIYAGGMHVATHTLNPAQTGTDTYFHHNDWLGTERARTDYAGNLCETITSLPFGDGQAVTSSCLEGDVSPMHFTGKERDSESGLDNFDTRYFGSSMGLFMSPDPDNAGARLEAPQSWNAYSYVLNNPLNYIDPFGLDCVYLNEGGDKVQEVKSGDCRSETDNGYYVNGTIQGGINGVGLTPDNNTIVYSYTNEDQPGTQYGHQCVGDCSGPDYTVTVSSAPPGTPTMSGAPAPGTLQPPIFPRQPTTFWQRLSVVAGCMAGLDPELMQPMNLQPEAPTSPPNDSTKESEGQKRAQVLGPDGRPLQYRNGRPVSPNPQGARNAETVTAAAGGVAAAANASQCIGNAAKQ